MFRDLRISLGRLLSPAYSKGHGGKKGGGGPKAQGQGVDVLEDVLKMPEYLGMQKQVVECGQRERQLALDLARCSACCKHI